MPAFAVTWPSSGSVWCSTYTNTAITAQHRTAEDTATFEAMCEGFPIMYLPSQSYHLLYNAGKPARNLYWRKGRRHEHNGGAKRS